MKKNSLLIKIKLIFAWILCVLGITSCTRQSDESASADQETLIIATSGKVINLNLEQKKIQWQYQSKYNQHGNRNWFSLSGDLLYQPFESGEFIAFNINDGKIAWQEHILGAGGGNQDAVATDDGQLDTGFVNSLKPLFMTQALVTENNVYISSTNQPESSNVPSLYNFDKKTGKTNWIAQLPTVYNLFKPVALNNFIFVNSAVYLDMFSTSEGTSTSYGTFDGTDEFPNAQPSQFTDPIYAQMQSDGKNLYVGDEKGRFYALHFDDTNSLPVAEITDPNNTFAKNPKLFEWKFEDSSISSIQDGYTALHQDLLIFAVNQKDKPTPALVAIDKGNGKLKWKTELNSIENWRQVGDKITVAAGFEIYILDTDGKLIETIDAGSQFAPISNIEIDKNGDLLYATEQGIVRYDAKAKTFDLVLEQAFKKDDHNNFQVKYLRKK